MLERIRELFALGETAQHLEQALTHPSFANESNQQPDNQRLEFLGDAVLGFCVSELLVRRFPDADEGTLTRLRAELVNAEALARWARAHDVPEALRLGKGARGGRLEQSTNVLADAVEALIAACFLDSGLDETRRVCERIVDWELESLNAEGARDAKSELQERLQALGLGAPRYRVLEMAGPAHQRWFEMEVTVGEAPLARGEGKSKRLAEQAAARAALAMDLDGLASGLLGKTSQEKEADPV
jgi:ribonuclease III